MHVIECNSCVLYDNVHLRLTYCLFEQSSLYVGPGLYCGKVFIFYVVVIVSYDFLLHCYLVIDKLKLNGETKKSISIDLQDFVISMSIRRALSIFERVNDIGNISSNGY